MKILGNEIKPGMIIEHKDDLWEVLKTQHVKPVSYTHLTLPTKA